MSYFELELEFVHATYADAAEHNVGLEIAAVFGGADEYLEIETEGLDVREVSKEM
jgi:hypothetical protein